MPKCPKCGEVLVESEKHCTKCGAKVDFRPKDSPNSDSKSNNSSKLIIGIVIAIIIIAIVGAFASGVFTSNDSPDDNSVETSEPISEDSVNDSSSSESAATEYWASAKAEKFHLPDCEWAQKISEDNKIIYDSREDAIADGKIPCGACNP